MQAAAAAAVGSESSGRSSSGDSGAVTVDDVRGMAFALTGRMLASLASPLQAGADHQSQRRQAFKLLGRALGNIAASPGEVKFRALRCSNRHVARMLSMGGTRELLLAVGFADTGQGTLALPAEAKLDLLHAALEVVLLRQPVAPLD